MWHRKTPPLPPLPPKAGDQQLRAQGKAEGCPEPNAYSAVALCFSSMKDIIFVIAVVPSATTGEELAFTWRGDNGTLCMGSSCTPFLGEVSPH